MHSVKERRPAQAPAPIRLEIRAAHPDEADEKLNEAVQELQVLAAVERSRGILVTRTGAGRYTVELSREVPYGFTEEAVA
ncbi:hypothetical protein LVY72_20525 [Arthrobacter sp. I2-34]|uniref:Uncharacterized protein n=1 Tax=Arthrobacter hankyongi TaxID=2904801 RepID=A0ABS9LC73_9MICC|nr:hypothetical protein [Arthrobacter hankyongi]MCG2624279.1 hypothetical protein [Arthrobacter hankyongi]